jgi:DNA-binding response OmpR family regulator
MSTAYTILIIDDEPNLRRSLALILQRAGYGVTTAESAEQVQQYLQAGAYDLVFLDLKMPDINGLELLPQIRTLYPEMPVLILTAHATLDSAIEAVRKGARDYLLKPIDPEQILSRVSEILDEQQHPRRRREIVGEIQSLLNELNQANRSDLSDKTASKSAATIDPARILRRGPFILDLHARYASLSDQLVPLSPTAFDYLATLVRHSPNPVSYETLVMESQGYKTTPVEAREMARWRIHELRKALETDTRNPTYIITVRDVGYRLVT